jgi:nitrogen regulatory protein PII
VKVVQMKLIMICYNEAIDDEITELLQQADVKGYTKWTKVLGKGQTSEPHLLSHIWPKANNVIAIAVEENVAKIILEKVRDTKAKAGTVGLKAFMWEIEDIT